MMLVELMGKYNILTPDKTILLSRWVDDVRRFHDGFTRICIKGKGYNLINRNGEIISKVWFDDVGNFRDGFATVNMKGEYYYLDENGKLYKR